MLDARQDTLVPTTFIKHFLFDEHITIDANHFELHDVENASEKKEANLPKKSCRKTKEGHVAWLNEEAEIKTNLTSSEKKLEVQLSIPSETLWQGIRIE